MAQPLPSGTELLVRYNVGGVETWHARLVHAHITGAVYAISSPDSHVYCEDYSNAADFTGVTLRPGDRSIPAQIVPAHVYLDVPGGC